MFLSPSKILYTHRCDPDICSSTEKTFMEVTKTIQRGTVFPKLQVVKKDGFYFTLNDAKLQVYRHLEELGKCGTVEVEKVNIKEVPEGIRQLMKAPDRIRRCKGSKSKNKERGKYHSIASSANTADSADEADKQVLSRFSGDDTQTGDTDESDSSDYKDTDSDDSSDWSDEELSATDIESDNGKSDGEDNPDHTTENESFI